MWEIKIVVEDDLGIWERELEFVVCWILLFCYICRCEFDLGCLNESYYFNFNVFGFVKLFFI